MSTKILAFSGKKQAGKDSLASFLVTNRENLFCTRPGPFTTDCHVEVDVKVYSLAYKAKKFMVDCLGLTEQQAWGPDTEKNTLTPVLWENLPHYHNLYEEWRQDYLRSHPHPIPGMTYCVEDREDFQTCVKKGRMTAREVMEQFMEGVMRKMYSPSVKEPCLKQIAQERPFLALIIDLRRQEEFEAIEAAGGRVIRLTRTIPSAAANRHISNTDLDQDRFDWEAACERGHAVIDNHDMTVEQSQEALLRVLSSWGWINSKEV